MVMPVDDQASANATPKAQLPSGKTGSRNRETGFGSSSRGDAFGLIEAMAAFLVLLLATSAIVAARRYGRAATGLGAYSGHPD